MSIRVRLTLTYSAMLLLILLIFGGIVASVQHRVQLDTVDLTLEKAVSDLSNTIEGRILVYFPYLSDLPQASLQELQPLNLLAPNLGVFQGSNIFIQIWNTDSRLISSSTNMLSYRSPLDEEALTTTQETRRTLSINGVPVRVITRPVMQAGRILGHIQGASNISTIVEGQQRILLLMLVAGAFALFASVIIGSALLERALQPIESIADAASQIATGDDLSRRIAYDGPPDELGTLTEVFNATLGRLQNLFMAQRRFVADVSHELRTPLTVIQANTDLIRRYGPDEDSLKAIDSESKRMTRLVGDLLLLAQADAGELLMVKQNMELDTLLLSVYEQSKVLSESRATIKLGRFEPVRVQADPDRLTQLLLNLVANAIKYTPAEGTITLSVWPEGARAMMAVADTGDGIPAEDLPHIFDRFYRVDKARARKHGGVGLGLSIADWIARAHGGQITVTSTRGQGTTFTVHLPRQSPPESIMETRPAIRLPLSLRRGGDLNGGLDGDPR